MVIFYFGVFISFFFLILSPKMHFFSLLTCYFILLLQLMSYFFQVLYLCFFFSRSAYRESGVCIYYIVPVIAQPIGMALYYCCLPGMT